MFLTVHNQHRLTSPIFVFTSTDPRDYGFEGEVTEGVEIIEQGDLSSWPDGDARPMETLAQSINDPSVFHLCKHPNQVPSGFRPLVGQTYIGESLDEFEKLIGEQ